MSAKYIPPSIEVLKDWLKKSLEVKDLTDWERSFLSNISMRLYKGMSYFDSKTSNLSREQIEKLEQIYMEKTK